MKGKLLSMSLYWKCQLAGWVLIYTYSTFLGLLNKIPLKNMIPLYLIFIVLGILLSHLMKSIMDQSQILQKKIFYQMSWILISTIILSSLFTFTTAFIIASINSRNFFYALLHPNRSLIREIFIYIGSYGVVFLVWNLLYFAYHYFQKAKKEERLKFNRERELLEMEAKALRAQMNPHFIFNCLNSIKSLIQQNENEKSVTYLTTFSKLIRNLLNNADKKEISLFDEIETCKLYLQLEAMRFDAKFSYAVNVDDIIDLKSIQVPALIIQPFIENAIWHGIVPRNTGGRLLLNVLRKDGVIEIIIDDDGIGREASQQNNSASGLVHQSKGVNLTQTRLELNNLLQQKQAGLEVIDKRGENGMATGTTIIIKIKEELS